MSDNRARIWFSLFVLAVFCLGGASGFFLGRHTPPMWGGRPPAFDGGPEGRPRAGGLFGPGRRGGGPPFGRGGGPPPLPPRLLERLSSQLQLDAAQQEQLKKVLDVHRDHLDQVHREAREKFDKEQEELHAAIRGVLRPDQQQKFEEFLTR